MEIERVKKVGRPYTEKKPSNVTKVENPLTPKQEAKRKKEVEKITKMMNRYSRNK